MDVSSGLVTDVPIAIDSMDDDTHDTSVSGNGLVDDVLQQHGDGALDGDALREKYQSLLSEKQRVVELLESERLKNTQLENQLAMGNFYIHIF